MSYCTISEVKVILQIQAADTTFNTEISECITSAAALVDGLLKNSGLTIPAPTPKLITDATAHYTAWLFRRRRDPAGAETFWVEAKRFLDVYIDANAKPYVGMA